MSRLSAAAGFAMRHGRVAGGGEKDEEHEKMMETFGAYEGRVKTLVAMTLDARAQLAEAFLQLGFAAQCFKELTAPEVDIAGSGALVNAGAPLPDAQRTAALAARVARSRAIAGLLQEAFHASFGEALQTTLLTPLESEVELFEKTHADVAKHHEARLENQHYASKLSSLQQKTGESDKEREKLQRNADKAAEANTKLQEAKAQLQADLAAHDAVRKEVLTRRVNELKGMLHRFCEAALRALGTTESEERELDRYNVYGDVNVESAMSKLRRGITTTTRGAGRYGESVALRVAHMRRHAATTFTKAKIEKDAHTEDPVELETNEMASRYEKAWSVLERLPHVLEALRRWYEAGFGAFTGVAAELAAAVKDEDAPEEKAVVLQFHAALDEVRATLSTTVVARVLEDVVQPLGDSLLEFKELPEKLRDRRAKALESEHYHAKVASLEKRTHSDKASETAKEKAAERWERNKTKASTADEAAKAETLACRDRLLAFDEMIKLRVETTATSLDTLQREFYLDFAAKVAAKLQLSDQASPADAASASKLTELMSRGIIVPQSGMTLNKSAAADFQRTRSDTAGGVPPRASFARPPPPPVPQPVAPPVAPQPGGVRPPAPPVPQPAVRPSQGNMTELMSRKASLSADEAAQVRQMMMQQKTRAAPTSSAPCGQQQQQQHQAAPVPPYAQQQQHQAAPAAWPAATPSAFAQQPPAARPEPPTPPVPTPPPPPPRAPPGMIEVKALYDFDAVQSGDLAFKTGDVILTDEATFNAAGGGGWINGELAGKSGVFPSNYVQPL
ncbi:hypothetical protein CTAYLR_009495 [Chrysophaeum taylorii]|uniref:SH3 domain-containing protein n=1 Tax=Chrysophaeum taylorii TaxID=2483200 RepID=A0AAD7UIT9_9STRA|nr:hypothetical protein CTAYLR_009495 [Chrysophaeum taylorii]